MAPPQRAASSSSSSHQRPITCFFQGNSSDQLKNAAATRTSSSITATQMRKRRKNGSMFGQCPLCQVSFPLYKLEHHAADCNGTTTNNSSSKSKKVHDEVDKKRPRHQQREDREESKSNDSSPPPPTISNTKSSGVASVAVTTTPNEPLPGLFLYENFITEEEEAQILAELDGESVTTKNANFHHQDDKSLSIHLPWKPSTFNGKHRGKRWGVHCNLRDRKVSPAENPLPPFIQNILLPKLAQLLQQQKQQQCQQQQHACGPPPLLKKKNKNNNNNWMSDFIPNEANALDYRRDQGDYLKDHVDDRQLSKEPIANLSLAGDCYMTFTNVKATNNSSSSSNTALLPSPRVLQVFLPRRCLQILTGKARYDYSHGIQHCHLLSPRRVSVTMRESPLTISTRTKKEEQTRLLQATVTATTCKAPKTSIGSSSSFFTARETKKTDDSSTISPALPLRRVSTGSPAQSWTEQPIPGLYLFHDFISPEEELQILQELDRPETTSATSAATWKTERHSGTHYEKRWGMDHDLWSPIVRPPKHPLPNFMETIIISKLKQLPVMVMQGSIPNEVNSIDYRRQLGHSLKLHADDRQKYKEPIANLSLAGDCIMTYNNLNVTENSKRVLLPRRCLQVLTGKARYDFAHGIANPDLLSDRRVSLTMREMRL